MLTRTIGWIDRTSPGTRKHFVPVCAIIAITVLFFLPVLRGRSFSMVGAHMFAQYPWIGVIKNSPEVRGIGYPQTDHADYYYPNAVFATNAVRSGQFPMWLPYNFSGVPQMQSDPGAGLLYPPKLVAMILLSPIRQHDLMLFTHLLLAGLGMYALLRSWGANSVGAVFGAIVWEFNGRNSFWLTLEFFTIAASWLPVMLLGATLTVRKQSVRWAVATGFALAMAMSIGIVGDAYSYSFLLAGWFLGLTIPAARRLFLDGQRRSAMICLSLPLIAGLTALALSAPAWLLVLDLLSHINRHPFTLADQLIHTVPLRSFIRALVFPVSSLGPAGKQADFPSFGFVGVPALIFIVPGLFRRSALGTLAIITGVLSLAFALGLRPLIIVLRQVWPYFDALKLWEFFNLFCFAVAILAALGITEIISRFNWPGARRNLFLACAVSLVAVESGQLILFSWTINPSHPVKSEWLFPETPLISNLKNLQGEYHFLPISFRDPSGLWTPPVFGGKVNANFGLRSSSGSESLLPISTSTLWRTVELGGVVPEKMPAASKPYFYHDNIPLGLLEKLSIGFIVTPPNTEPRDVNGANLVANGSLQPMYKGPDGWIYKLPHALPRAFLVPSVSVAANSAESLRMLVNPTLDVRKAAIVNGSDTAAKTGLPLVDPSMGELAAKATIVSDRLNEVEVDVDTPRSAMLVLNDMWDGGWKVEVDRVKQPLLEVNYAFRGVVVPAGKHRVMFRYRPAPLFIGLGISGATIFLLLVAGGLLEVRRLRGILRDVKQSSERSETAKENMGVFKLLSDTWLRRKLTVQKWSAHNVALTKEVTTIPGQPDFLETDLRLHAILRTLSLLYRGRLADLRVADLGCLEGGFALALAQRGMDVVGIEARAKNLKKAEFLAKYFNLPNLKFELGDVKHFTRETFGDFDVVLALGILYHLDEPAAWLRQIAEATRSVLIIDSHFAPTDDASLAVLDGTIAKLGPLEWVADVKWRYEGRWFVEHAEYAMVEDRVWASYSNKRSFWLTKESLLQALSNVGFDLVYEQHDYYGLSYARLATEFPRVMLVAVKGDNFVGQ